MTSEKALKVIMRIEAVMAMTAIVPMAMPLPWMDAIHRWLGLGPMPQGPVVEYLARSISGMYAILGAYLWLLSTDIRRYAAPIRLWSIAVALFGVCLLVIDTTAGLPLSWILGEGPFLILMGAVAITLLGRIDKAAPPPAEEREGLITASQQTPR